MKKLNKIKLFFWNLLLKFLYFYCRPLWNRIGVKTVDEKIVYFWRKNFDITIWRRWDEQLKKREHNHIEQGKAEGDKPVGNKHWEKGKWQKSYGKLINGVVIEK